MATEAIPDNAPSSVSPPGLGEWPGFQLYKCGWWLQQELKRRLEPLELNERHLMVLTMLSASDELSQQQMADYMSLNPTLMVALIDDLERRGLCTRGRNQEDRRRYVVQLTTRGRKLYDRARALADQLEDEVFAPLTARDRTALTDALNRVMVPYWNAKESTRPRV